MSSAAEIRKLMEEQQRVMAARLAQAEENERQEAEARRVAEEEQVAAERRAEEARRLERQALLDAEEEAEQRATEKVEQKVKRRAERKRRAKEEIMGASSLKRPRVATEEPEDMEEGACWNCRSRSIPCKRIR